MSKYLPLAAFLRRQAGETVVLTLAEIERIVGRLLPKALGDPAWWRADATSPQPQQRVFAECGFDPEPDLRKDRVMFVRASSASSTSQS